MLPAVIIALFKSTQTSLARVLRTKHPKMGGTGVVLLVISLAQISIGCGRMQAQVESPKPCIMIQQTVPNVVKGDGSGNTTEPIRITIVAVGSPEDLKDAKVIYLEDGSQKSAIPIPALHAGAQTVTIPAGLHMNSSSETFDMTVNWL
jgi:hypothetical protein